jgi:hypothetical protein
MNHLYSPVVTTYQPQPRVLPSTDTAAPPTRQPPESRLASPPTRRLDFHSASTVISDGGSSWPHSPSTVDGTPPHRLGHPLPPHNHSLHTRNNVSRFPASSSLSSSYLPAEASGDVRGEEESERVRLQVSEALELNAIIDHLRQAQDRDAYELGLREDRSRAAARAAEHRANQRRAEEAAAAQVAATTTADQEARRRHASGAWEAYKAAAERQGVYTPTRHGPAAHVVLVRPAASTTAMPVSSPSPRTAGSTLRTLTAVTSVSPAAGSTTVVRGRLHSTSPSRAARSSPRRELWSVISESHQHGESDGRSMSMPQTFDDFMWTSDQLLQLVHAAAPTDRLADQAELASSLLLDRWAVVAAAAREAHMITLLNAARATTGAFHHEVALRDETVRRLLLENRSLSAKLAAHLHQRGGTDDSSVGNGHDTSTADGSPLRMRTELLRQEVALQREASKAANERADAATSKLLEAQRDLGSVMASMKHLQRQLESRDEQVSLLKEQLASRSRESDAGLAAVRGARSELDRLAKALATAEAEARVARDGAHAAEKALREEHTAREAAAQNAAETRVRLEERVAALDATTKTEAQRAREKSLDALLALQTRLASKDDEIAALTARFSQISTDNASLEASVARLQKTLEDEAELAKATEASRSDEARRLRDELRAALATSTRLEEDLAALEKRAAGERAERDAASRTSVERLRAAETENESLRREASRTSDLLASTHAQLRSLQSAESDRLEHSTRDGLDALKTRLATAETRLAETDQDLEAALEENADLAHKLAHAGEKLEAALADAETARKHAATSIANSGVRNVEAQRLQEELQASEESIALLMDENAELKSQLYAARGKVANTATLQERLEAAEAQRTTLQAQLDAASRAADGASVASAFAEHSTREQVATLEAQVARLSAKLAESKKAQVEMEAVAEAAIDDADATRTRCEALQNELKEHKAHSTACDRDLETANIELAEALNSVERLQLQLANAHKKVAFDESAEYKAAQEKRFAEALGEAVSTATTNLTEEVNKSKRKQSDQRQALREALELAAKLKIDLGGAASRDGGQGLQSKLAVQGHVKELDAWSVRFGRLLS